jgi:hypothetical protein
LYKFPHLTEMYKLLFTAYQQLRCVNIFFDSMIIDKTLFLLGDLSTNQDT